MEQDQVNSLFVKIDELQESLQTQQELIVYLLKDIKQIKSELTNVCEKKQVILPILPT
ncbi:hypothetical protein QNI19_16375 [Cytophagaceae bacterium DM2B3-1]|uniref:SlyX protein n=1 Tax=Xanthocytophaga flava TaxID=3048013 RepID=A0ABT7CLB0_9BACT|nr:hypothetical protein [Xanthocytophaga flavus]MDJ1494522.1 hypothetical protein [Xanthocytophaga flavus]